MHAPRNLSSLRVARRPRSPGILPKSGRLPSCGLPAAQLGGIQSQFGGWRHPRTRQPHPATLRRIPRLALALFVIGIASLLGAIALVAFAGLGDGDEPAVGSSRSDNATPDFAAVGSGPRAAPLPSEPRLSEPPPTEPRKLPCHTIASVSRPVVLYREPGGSPLIKVRARTEWKSPRVFGVARRKGEWLGVQAPELPNGELGWLPAHGTRLNCTTWSLHADLSKRKLFVRREGRTVRRLAVAIGRAGNPTPMGRFSVTDKLRVTDPGSPYGCCVLALTGHQTNLPAGWAGGDRLAVHATQDLASIGQAASLGCLRADARHARWLIETIPLGAPVFVRS
jgi:L,D-transpeptidase catalytic domain